MFAEGFAVLVEELRIGRLQRPSELPGVTFAGVHLIALGMHLEQKFLVRGRLELRRNLLRGNGERKNRARGREQHAG
jgi:hypothetical protein